jgi:hypothetical protein
LDGYAIKEPSPAPPGAKSRAARILLGEPRRFLPLSARLETFDVFKLEKPFLAFAKITDEPSALGFVNQFGYPTADPHMSVHSVLKSAKDVRDVMLSAQTDSPEKFAAAFSDRGLGRSHIELRRLPGSFRVAIVPETLLGGLWIQIAQELAAGVKVHACDNCGSPFTAGVSGRRADARFCSEPCRKQAHYKSKRSVSK